MISTATSLVSIPREVFSHLGVGIRDSKITEITDKGLVNKVFRLETDKGNFIVRMTNYDSSVNYEKESWCMKQARIAGVPTTDCLEIGKDGERSFMLQHELVATDGRELNRNNSLLGTSIELMEKLGQYARQINSIHVSGFGYRLIDPEQNQFGYSSWQTYTEDMITDFSNSSVLQDNEIITAQELDRALKRFEKMKAWSFQPSLAHGDIAPRNAMVNTHKEVFLIDWGTAEASHAKLRDLSEVFAWQYTEAERAAFLKGYGISTKELREIKHDIDTFTIKRYMSTVRWMITSFQDWKNNEILKHASVELKKLLCA